MSNASMISPNLDPAATSRVSLDTLLEQIQHESTREQTLNPMVSEKKGQSQGLRGVTVSNGNLTAHVRSQLTAMPSTSPATQGVAPNGESLSPSSLPSLATMTASGLSEIPADDRQETPLSDRQELWESRLTDRQKSLPKISYRMLGSVVAILLLVFGVGSATVLTQESQDIRNQAFEQTLAPVSGPSAVLTQQEIEAQQRLAQAGVVDTTVQRVQEQIAGFELTSSTFAILAGAGLAVFSILAFLVWMSF